MSFYFIVRYAGNKSFFSPNFKPFSLLREKALEYERKGFTREVLSKKANYSLSRIY